MYIYINIYIYIYRERDLGKRIEIFFKKNKFSKFSKSIAMNPHCSTLAALAALLREVLVAIR